nr:fucose isomerase [Clostridia bacterium]
YYGTPTCPVLSMLNTTGIPAACEDDVYGALSMWVGVQLSGEPSFFGDPICLNEKDNTITYWHCGMGACSLARKDTGAQIGLHPNRFVGPVMDFACEPCEGATIFRIGREPDGSFRFFIAEGTAPDVPKQYIGTSFTVKTDNPCRDIIEKAVMDGFEPHFAVVRGRHGKTLEVLAHMLECKIYNY